VRKIVKRPLARQDLKHIWRYSFKEWGEAQADKYFAEIEAGILKLQAHPHLGKSREDLRAGYYALRVNQHVGYYMLNTRCAAGDEAARPTLRATRQPDLSAHRTVVRGTLSFCADRSRRLSPRLSALHRTEPCAGRHGRGTWRVSQVELPSERARTQ